MTASTVDFPIAPTSRSDFERLHSHANRRGVVDCWLSTGAGAVIHRNQRDCRFRRTLQRDVNIVT